MDRSYFEKYVSHMTSIRTLSSPHIGKDDSSELYSERLRENFQRIGKLARENYEILEELVFPIINGDDRIDDEVVEAVRKFNDELVNGNTVENLDVAIMSLLTDRLVQDAEEKQNTEYLIEQLDNEILCCNIFLYITSRITTKPEFGQHFRERGFDASKRLLKYLEPERFSALSDDSKGRVLTNLRFYTTLFGSVAGISADDAHRWVGALKKAVSVYDDPFYREALPSFNWDYYIFRTLEHYSVILDYFYVGSPYDEDISIIVDKLKRQEEMWKSDPERFGEFATLEFIETSLFQGRFMKGEITLSEYREKLLSLYKGRDSRSYDYDNIYVNLRTAMNYILSMNGEAHDERDSYLLRQFYEDICGYVFRMPNSGTLSELMEYFTPVILHFIEVPGGVSFADMCLRLLAAFHPPTYVHSVMVAKISRCLAGHLIDTKPELFVGIAGVKNKDEVRENRDKLLLTAYRAGLYHDFGKLPMIDTIFVYGRKLLDFEFDIIKQHPDMGYEMMKSQPSTREYADVARGHHKWYDNSAGYPEDFDTWESPLKPIIDIVECADCMDAATDAIGRSYSGGKTLMQFKQELRWGAGTRYSPDIADMLNDENVNADIEYLLSEGRRNNYRNTFLLLREVQEREEQA